MNTFDPYALECLAAVVKEGSFERAAAQLSITQSAVSQRLRALEEQAGAVLVVRSRPIAATAAGSLLLKHAMHMRLMRADLQRDLQGLATGTPQVGSEQEQISIAINSDSIATWALPALDHLASCGQTLEIITDHLDCTQDWLRQGRALGCVSTLQQPLPGCKMVALGAMNYVAVAHPGFAARHCPHGLTPHNFRTLPFVAFDRKDDVQRQFVAHVFGLKSARIRQLFVPSLEGQLRAVGAQWGISVVPELYASTQIRRGELVNLTPGKALPIPLYWHCWGLASRTLDLLTEALTTAAAVSLVGADCKTTFAFSTRPTGSDIVGDDDNFRATALLKQTKFHRLANQSV